MGRELVVTMFIQINRLRVQGDDGMRQDGYCSVLDWMVTLQMLAMCMQCCCWQGGTEMGLRLGSIPVCLAAYGWTYVA